jgi:hypothetical protein
VTKIVFMKMISFGKERQKGKRKAARVRKLRVKVSEKTIFRSSMFTTDSFCFGFNYSSNNYR